jgi:lysophospholipase L1-like esterase
VAGFHNFTGSNLSNWATARAAVLAGTRNAKILPFGDSTDAGFGSNAGVADGTHGWPSKLVPLLGVTASNSSWYGDYNQAAILTTFDPRLALGSWAAYTPVEPFSFGGHLLTASASAGALSFTPTNSVDTFELTYATFIGAGSFSYQIDGGAPTTVSTNVATSVTTIPIPTTLGAHTLNILWVSGSVFISGARAYNSAAKQVSVINSGISGATSTQLADVGTFPWHVGNEISTLAPDLTIIEGGVINNWVTGISRATTIANLQTMITAAKRAGAGDVILRTPNPSQAAAFVPYATQQGYVDDMIALAITNNIPCIDVWRLFGGTWEAANASGYNSDTAHPNGAGYAAIAGYIAQGLTPGFKSNAGA